MDIPANTSATVHVPASDPARVSEGGAPAREAEGVSFLRVEEGAAIFRVVAGRYRFTVNDRPRSERKPNP